MDQWTQCQTCGLKFRARADGCPRCAKAVTEQPPPDLRDQIPESPVYEPPRYEREGEARITEYATGEAAEGPGPFRLPWYLMGGTLVLIVLGAIISPARPVIGLLMIGVGALFSIGASFWTLSVCWGFFGSLFIPVVGLIALFRANNLRPLGLSVAATFMMGGGASLAIQARGAVKNVRPLTDEVSEIREVTEIRDLSREEFVAECTKKEGAFRCGCKTAALYDELGQDVRLRVLNGRQTAADAARLNEAVRRNCKGSR